MASNTYDTIPADRVEVLAEGAPLPSPEVLGDKSATRCVWSDILKPIASDPTPMALRYLGTWAKGAAGLRAENLDLNNTDTADRITSLTTFCAGTETISRYPSYGTDAYAYAYDNIGNLESVQKAAEETNGLRSKSNLHPSGRDRSEQRHRPLREPLAPLGASRRGRPKKRPDTDDRKCNNTFSPVNLPKKGLLGVEKGERITLN